MMNQTTHQKPIELEVSFKYICPNSNCDISHWLFLREAKTKNFKVVCECGTTFKPQRVKNIQVVYSKPRTFKNKVDNQTNSDKICNSDHIISRAVGMMKSLGYSEKESLSFVNAACAIAEYNDPKILVKTAISNFGEKNV